MTDDGVLATKCRLLELFSELDDAEMDTIEQWIINLSYKKDLEKKKLMKRSVKKLNQIRKTLKKILPLEAVMPSETILVPTVGEHAACNKTNTCHVDEFLYAEDEVENLVQSEKLERRYCLDCSSRNVKDLKYISHSMSREQIQYIFKVLLPNDLDRKQILDVGSRLGAVLYGAYYFSNAAQIIGIEMNKELCDIQQMIIQQYSIDCNRVRVVHSDVMERIDLVANSNVIIVNIPDFFIDTEKHKEMWYFFKKHIKKGTYLVSTRSMADTLNSLDMFEELMDWLEICKPNQLENEVLFDLENCSELYLYKIN